MKLFASALGLFWLLVILASFACWLQGLILVFSASLLLGVICCFFAVPFVFFGLFYWVTGVDVAQRIVVLLPGIFG